jgi:hypothetical protein
MAESLHKSDKFTMGFLPALFMLLTVGQAVAVCALADPSLEERLEAAVYREIVLGDLKGAMEGFRGILASADLPRSVAARALLQLGQCLEKTGQREAAHQPYLRVVKEFSDQSAIAALASARLAGWEESFPAPRNLKFDQGSIGRAPPGWSVPALPKEADQWAQLKGGTRGAGCRGAHSCAVVLGVKSPVGVGNLYQSISAAAYRGKTIRLRAWLRLEDAADASDRAQLWLSVDRGKGTVQSFENTNSMNRPVQSDEWAEREITAEIAKDATFIEFGIMSYGRGRAWVDDVSFEIVVGR